MSDVSETSFFLPEHLISNILLRLPVKSVLVCTSVCKAWNSFIKSPSFVPSHLSLAMDNDTRLYLLQLGSCATYYESAAYSFSLRSDDEKLSEYSPIHFPYKHKDGFQVLSSCNGLVLLMNGNFRILYHLILWNPVIRKSVIIAKGEKNKHLETVGLGFDSRTCDYKVLTVVIEKGDRDVSHLKLVLYSLKTNSWKRLPDVDATPQSQWLSRLRSEMVYLNGALHYIVMRGSGGRKSLILVFDLDGEVFREIELPDSMSRDVGSGIMMYLWAYKESLSVSWQREIDRGVWECEIWVMEKYGVSESWTHLFSLSDEEISMFPCSGLVHRNDGNIVLSAFLSEYYPSLMISHNPKSQETKLGFFDGERACYFLDNYVESLVLLDKGDDLSKVFGTDSCNPNDASLG